MSDYSPINNVETFTATVSAGGAVVGGQLVVAAGTAGQVAVATTGGRAIGVALHDAPIGSRLTCSALPGAIHETTIEGVLSVVGGTSTIIPGTTGFVKAGAGLATDAAAGTLIGMALTSGTGGTGTGKCRWIGV